MKLYAHGNMAATDRTAVRQHDGEDSFTVLEFAGEGGHFTIHVDGTAAQREQFLRTLGQQLLEQSSQMRRDQVAAVRALKAVQ